MEPAPPPNFSWCLPGVLSACAFPAEAEHLEFLSRAGVTCLVSLTAEREVKVAQDHGVKIMRLPVTDFRPPTVEQAQAFVDAVEETRQKGRATCVHCAHGQGRTGTMVACYFLFRGADNPEVAIDRIRELRPGSIETKEQEEFVYKYQEYLLQSDEGAVSNPGSSR